MGLYQARRSLRDAQGDLQVSDESQGVIFSIVVPLSTQQRQEI
jgi:sensor histidine kinase regulating citrate/malate metabolism